MDPEVDYTTFKETTDPFNGIVAIFESELAEHEEMPFWVEHQRKDIITEWLTLEDSEAAYNEFVSDTMF